MLTARWPQVQHATPQFWDDSSERKNTEKHKNRGSVAFGSRPSHLWQVVAAVAALSPVQQGLQLGQVAPQGPWWLLLLLMFLLQLQQLLALLAVLLHCQALGWTKGRQQWFGPQRATAAPRPRPRLLLLLVRQRAHDCLVQHLQPDLGHGALEAVLGGQAVVEALVRRLHPADQQALPRGQHALAQLYLWMGRWDRLGLSSPGWSQRSLSFIFLGQQW